MKLAFGENPRSLVIVPSAPQPRHIALVFQVVPSQSFAPDQCSARFQPVETLDLREFEDSRQIYGCLGVFQIEDDAFVGVISEAQKVDEIAGSPIYRIARVQFFSLLTNTFDEIDAVGPETNKGVGISNVGAFDGDQATVTHPCAAVAKILSSGSFFFSPKKDLTRTLQAEAEFPAGEASLFDICDPHFFWNSHMLGPILQLRERDLSPEEKRELDEESLLVAAIQGFVGSADFSLNSEKAKIAIISRLSCRHAGTRFNARGIDDDGNVSNFVETEFIFQTQASVLSFVQIRGSVPVFWEQTGFQVTPKIDIARGPESTAPAFRRHMEELQNRYSHVHIVNLLGQKEGSVEFTLSEAYRLQLRKLNSDVSVGYTPFDFHAVIKAANYEKISLLVDQLRQGLDSWSYYLREIGGPTVLRQVGTVRTNCLDCLDRTNVVQCAISKSILERALSGIASAYIYILQDEGFLGLFNGLWADFNYFMACALLTSSAGTGALKSSVTRKGKQTVLGILNVGFLDDAAKSVNRFYINNFQDKGRQEAIDIILGKNIRDRPLLLSHPVHDAVLKELEERIEEYSSKEKIQIVLGTWNVNGKQPFGENVEPWFTSKFSSSPHLIILGIQELIELTAQQYVTADTEKLRATWEGHLLTTVNQKASRKYVLLRSSHLIALAIFVFVRQDCVDIVRNVELANCKTGLGGMAGNKGGVAVSMLFYDTRFAFVTAHLAAGEKAVEERNRDYWTITQGLSFRGRKLHDHDAIFWLGDFNYRVSLPTDEVRQRIDSGDLAYLWPFDQLNAMRKRRQAFDGFSEGPLEFDPTYKYDNGTSDYDTSEKARVPSWTDRILHCGDGIRLLEYARAECLMSDHRPVRAVFEANCVVIDIGKRDSIKESIYRRTGGATETVQEPLKFRQKTKFVRPPSGALLIDLSSESWTITGNATTPSAVTSKSAASTFSSDDTFKIFDDRVDDAFSRSASSLPPPSSAEWQWWNRKIDEAWIPQTSGNAENPFYSL
ncbi:SacI homology domain-containing protein [Zopfochytrium polystomum]|nr:SacI homology domain-containing protein [Zopfochytrium polystomum]